MPKKLEDWTMPEAYEARLRPLETPEFAKWFDTYYGDGKDYPEDLLPSYLNERRFALIGWIAAMTPGASEMSEVEFVKAALRPELALAMENG